MDLCHENLLTAFPTRSDTNLAVYGHRRWLETLNLYFRNEIVLSMY